jgi:hypothetical protein
MSGFIQIVRYQTSRFDEVRQHGDALREKMMAKGANPPRQISITADRDNPGWYTTVIEFDSYEAAMANSNDPDVGEFSAKMGQLADGPPQFLNLDVVNQERFE